ncbi:hypothetical protein LX32DRAFT_173191 [Colletotrichum zoysiae]|uniref:Acyltransferase 3 domain-containing protein n=1 Tax=Colletotrichum zoysiae TaxID=1216348 RepID=A0AAD9H5M3_9PEZI|nr:hypothetical protein LX32DRAFT_173191 [Colletotrichum zoysiae]
MQFHVGLLNAFLPSFITGTVKALTRKSGDRPKPTPLGPTAYLDGLRGVAAFVVYIFHYSYLWYPQLRSGYGFDDDNRLFWQRPVVRILHSGRAGVTIFFVISGYVLTVKTLTLIHNRKDNQVLGALAGSAFRRPFRLCLPIIASTFVIALAVYAGWYLRLPAGYPPPRADTLRQQLLHWFWSTVDIMNPFLYVDRRNNMRGSIYNDHLWTIPVEFKGSLLVFVLLLMFARAKRWIHAAAVIGVAFCLAVYGDCDQALFAAGLLLAELSIVLPPNPSTAATLDEALPSHDAPVVHTSGLRNPNLIRHVVTVTLFLLGLHLMSYPETNGGGAPGFITLSQTVPAYYLNNSDRTQLFWNSVGSVIFIVALMYSPAASSVPVFTRTAEKLHVLRLKTQDFVGKTDVFSWAHARFTCVRSWAGLNLPLEKEQLLSTPSAGEKSDVQPLLQRPFTTRFAQHLGHISYSLYLFHGAAIHTVAVLWMVPADAAWTQTVKDTEAMVAAGDRPGADEVWRKGSSAYLHAFVWCTLINTLALLWVSEVFNRLVDVPAVRFTRWISKKAWIK